MTSLIKPQIYSHFTLSKSHSPYNGLQGPCDLDPIPVITLCSPSFSSHSTPPTWLLPVSNAGPSPLGTFSSTLLSTSSTLPMISGLTPSTTHCSIFTHWGLHWPCSLTLHVPHPPFSTYTLCFLFLHGTYHHLTYMLLILLMPVVLIPREGRFFLFIHCYILSI